MYTLADYLWMIGDERRVMAYSDALRDLIRPGDRVVEVGAGFGFFSVLAARAGASHVDAIEANPVVHLGPRIAARNGVGDRIAFHAANATRVSLETKADVLLADMRGPLPFAGRSLEVLIDARERFLRPGGMMISSRDTLFVAPSRTPAVFAREVEAILDRSEVDMEPVRRVLYDTPMRCAVAPGDLLHRGEAWTRLDYTTVNRTDHDGKASWVFDAGAEVAGLALWFETEFGNGARFSTAPGSGLLAYSQVFLPLESVVAVPAGGALSVELGVRLAHENYIWSWRTAVRAPGTAADLRATAQNSLAEVIIDPHAVPLTSMAIPSSLGPRGRALHALLDGVSQHHSGFDLARRLHSAEPTEFPNMEQAEAFVAHWLAQLEKLERGLD